LLKHEHVFMILFDKMTRWNWLFTKLTIYKITQICAVLVIFHGNTVCTPPPFTWISSDSEDWKNAIYSFSAIFKLKSCSLSIDEWTLLTLLCKACFYSAPSCLTFLSIAYAWSPATTRPKTPAMVEAGKQKKNILCCNVMRVQCLCRCGCCFCFYTLAARSQYLIALLRWWREIAGCSPSHFDGEEWRATRPCYHTGESHLSKMCRF